MNVLIATPDPREARRLGRVVSSLGHQPAIAATPDQVLERVRTARPDVALVGTLDDPWVQALDTPPGPHIYRIAMVGLLDGRTSTRVWKAGFDDAAAKSACPAELAGRVTAVERIRSWLPTMGDDFGAEVDDDLLATPLFLELGNALADEFGAMVGGALSAARAVDLGDLAYVAEIPLTLTAESLEITVGIGITAATADAFGTLLFGEPVGRDVMADAMREFANTAGGLLKRTGPDYGREFSLGLPTDAVFPDPPVGSPIWRLQGEGLELVVWAAQSDDRPQRLCTSMLAEGMVLTQPVLNDAGVMLVNAGAVLTQRTVSRLVELLGPSTLVEVARAA